MGTRSYLVYCMPSISDKFIVRQGTIQRMLQKAKNISMDFSAIRKEYRLNFHNKKVDLLLSLSCQIYANLNPQLNLLSKEFRLVAIK